MKARDFGISDDAQASVDEDVRPYRDLSPAERYWKFLDLMRFMERVRGAQDPGRRAHYDRVQDQFDDPGRWWERLPSR